MGNNHLADTIETSADELVGELKAVRDSVEELYILLDHMWRNREEIHDILVGIIEKRTEDSHEVTCCVHCDDSHSSLADAIRAGWTSLQHDPSDGWDYLGICGDCRREETQRDSEAAKDRPPDAETHAAKGSVNAALFEALRLLVQEIEQPEMADSYVAEAVKKARAIMEKCMTAGQEQDVESAGKAMGLSDDQIAQARAEGVTTALGLRRIEKNTRSDSVPETIACALCDGPHKAHSVAQSVMWRQTRFAGDF